MTTVGQGNPNSHVGLGNLGPRLFRFLRDPAARPIAAPAAAPAAVPQCDLPSWRDRFRGMWWGAAIAAQAWPDPTDAGATTVSFNPSFNPSFNLSFGQVWNPSLNSSLEGHFPTSFPSLSSPILRHALGVVIALLQLDSANTVVPATVPDPTAPDRDLDQNLDRDVNPNFDRDAHQDANQDAHQDSDRDAHQDPDRSVAQDSDLDAHQDSDQGVPQDPDQGVDQDWASADSQVMGAIVLPLALWQHDDPQRLAATLERAWADQGLAGRSPTCGPSG